MPSLLCLALSNAVLATILAVIVAVIARCCRRPAVRHALWLLVLLKLVTPPLLPLSIAWPRSDEIEPQPAELPQSAIVLPSESELSEPDAPIPEMPLGALTQPRSSSDSPSRDEFWIPFLIAIWLGGALTWWMVAAVRLGKFQRLLRQARPAPVDVQEQARRLAGFLGLRHRPPVVFVSAPLSPLLWALGSSPRLLVPKELWQKLTTEQQDTLLAHELAHLRRGDHWVRRLELFVLGLYWWHPVVWWARRRLQEAEEECCDALVVAVLPDAAPAYASALVETVSFLSQTRFAPLVGASGAGHVPLLKRRLTMILTETSSRKPSRIAFWTVLGLGALLLPLAPQAARTEVPEEPKPVEMKDRIDNFHSSAFFKSQDCAACHQAVMSNPHGVHGKPQSWQQAHEDVVRLLDEIKNQRAQLQRTEDRLKRALDAMKKLEPRGQSAGPGKQEQTYIVQPLVQQSGWNVTWAEALFDQRTHDMGSVKHGDLAERRFLMTNHGQRPVHIDSIRTSAGCLKATASEHVLPPGKSAAIQARLDTSRFTGKKGFKIYVQFDKPDRQEVVLDLYADSLPTAPAKPQSPQRLQELEKKLDALRKEMNDLRREMRPDKPR
jgi:beta-lactamase regulating signal transducer with metallopeptidase domain